MSPLALPVYYQQRIAIDGECWIWRGPVYGGMPTAVFADGRRSARRAVYSMAHRRLSSRQVVSLRCDNPLCIAPAHAIVMLRGSHLPSLPRTAKWIARKTLALRAIAPKLTLDKARAVRQRVADGEKPKALAIEYGVSKAMIHRVVRGDNWREPLSPLALLAQQAGML